MQTQIPLLKQKNSAISIFKDQNQHHQVDCSFGSINVSDDSLNFINPVEREEFLQFQKLKQEFYSNYFKSQLEKKYNQNVQSIPQKVDEVVQPSQKKEKKKFQKVEEIQPAAKNEIQKQKCTEAIQPALKNENKKFQLTDILRPVHPNQPKSAYMFFKKEIIAERNSKYCDSNHKINPLEINKLWKDMEQSKRNEYEALAVEDNKRYLKQKQQLEKEGFFIDCHGINSNDLILQNPKFLPHVVQPKKMVRPFCFFLKENYKIYAESNCGVGGKKNVGAYSKFLSDKWRDLTDDQRQIYFQKSEDDLKRYNKQCEELITKGYFILQDGSKSSELVQKVKKLKQKQIFSQATKEDTQSGLDSEDVSEPNPFEFKSSDLIGKKRNANQDQQKDERSLQKRIKLQ